MGYSNKTYNHIIENILSEQNLSREEEIRALFQEFHARAQYLDGLEREVAQLNQELEEMWQQIYSDSFDEEFYSDSEDINEK